MDKSAEKKDMAAQGKAPKASPGAQKAAGSKGGSARGKATGSAKGEGAPKSKNVPAKRGAVPKEKPRARKAKAPRNGKPPAPPPEEIIEVEAIEVEAPKAPGEPAPKESQGDGWEGRPFGGDEEPRRRQGGSALFGGLARRLVSQGVEAFGLGEEVARNLVNDKVSKESVAGLVESAIKSKEDVARLKDELQRATLKGKEEVGRLRGDVQKAMTREVRRQLERVDLKEEIAKVLADYQLEITARIHFVPRDDDAAEPSEVEDESSSGKGNKRRRRGKKRKKEDVQIRLTRKRDLDEVEMDPEEVPEEAPLTPEDYFDDDDDEFDEY